MHYAKMHQMVHPARYELSSSALAAAPVSEWPFVPTLDLQGHEPYGDVRAVEMLAVRYGVSVESVFPTPGTTVANLLAVGVLARGRPVAVELPGYEPIRSMVAATGARVRDLPRRHDWSIDLGEVEQVFRDGAGLLVVSDLYNPAGTTLAIDVLQRLDALARQHDAWVLVDEVYLDGLPHRRPPAAALGERLVSTAGLSKVYGLGGLRYGWLLAAPSVIEMAGGLADSLYAIMATPVENLALQVLEHLDWFKARYHRILGANRPIMEAWLDRHPERFCIRPPGGLIYFVGIDEPSETFDRRLRQEHETGMAPGHFFGDEGFIRIGIGGPSEILQAGLERIAAAC
jgi:hypothetical protein